MRFAVKQLVVGLLALPLSMVPFAAYATMTPEGRLVAERATVMVAPPKLPSRAPRVANPPRYSNAVAVLLYHGIGAGSDGDGDKGFAVSPKRFGEHLAALKAAGMHAVTAADVAAARSGGKPLPDNAVMISFDDGRADAIMYADPLLKQAHMKATMFVITEAAAHHGVYYASWDRLMAASKSGRWDLESHTASLHHEQRTAGGDALPALTSLAPGESLAQYRARVRQDLTRAAETIKAETGRAPVAFAYPFGAYGADRVNDPAVRQVLQEEVARRYSVAFHQDGQDDMRLMTAADTALELRRLEVGNWSPASLLSRIRAEVARTFPTAAPEAETDVTAEPAVATEPAPTTTTTMSEDPTTTTTAEGSAPRRQRSTTTTTSAAPSPSTSTSTTSTTSTTAPRPTSTTTTSTTVYHPPSSTTTTVYKPPSSTTTTTVCTGPPGRCK